MKIIFLDVDGVLNSTLYFMRNYKEQKNSMLIDPECMKKLQKIVEQTGSYIVISSTWRKREEDLNKLKMEFKKYNLENKVIGTTPVLNTDRTNEILTYIKSLKQLTSFVVLDDNQVPGFEEELVLIDSRIGLSDINVKHSIEVLNSRDRYIPPYIKI